MQRTDFHYHLPSELIARYPPACRADSRLLYLDSQHNEPIDHRFADLPGLLRPGDLLVLNDSQVIPARLFGRKSSGGRIEILLERILGAHSALAQLRSNRPLRPGMEIHLGQEARCRIEKINGTLATLTLQNSDSFAELLEEHGQVPLPPYLGRAAEPLDRERYQTIYARQPGSVAAPTAGLHFTPELMQDLQDRGIQCASLTLHVGIGTFQPIRSSQVEEHSVHREHFEVSEQLCRQLLETRRNGGRIIAVGTTSTRALETATQNGTIAPCCGETDLYIYPGYRFRAIDALLTNFHLSESSLLVLACAFAGQERLLSAYRHAIAQRYRFYSYGDAMLICR